MTKTWLTVDCDDIRHIPKHQGHPTRSKIPLKEKALSPKFKIGMEEFKNWLRTHSHPVTLFVIADAFQHEPFGSWVTDLIQEFGDRITIGCHGLNHRSWSAWPEDIDGFTSAIKQAIKQIKLHVGNAYCPWFRAPAGYMAPWMVRCIKQCGILVDSSINDTFLTLSKSGKGNTWQDVKSAITQNGLIERQWLTSLGLPVNGPALTRFPLSLVAKRAWKKLPTILASDEVKSAIESSNREIVTVYWHILDHARKQGKWRPPLPKLILNH